MARGLGGGGPPPPPPHRPERGRPPASRYPPPPGGAAGPRGPPAASPGPTDAHYLFTAFTRLMDGEENYLDIDTAKDRLQGWNFAETAATETEEN